MTKTISLAVFALIFPGAVFAQSPTFETNGFPVSLHQAQVTALRDMQERGATPFLVQNGTPMLFERDGIPATLTQALILSPHRVSDETEIVAKAKSDGR